MTGFDMVSNLAEDCLMRVLRAEGSDDISTKEGLMVSLGLDREKCDEMIVSLVSEGYVEVDGDVIELTSLGRRFADSLMHRHRMLEELLADMFDLPPDEVHSAACDLEHKLTDEQVERAAMKVPCPMPNKPFMPRGRMARVRRMRCSDSDEMIPLSQLKVGEEGMISHLLCGDRKSVRRLVNMGFVPGRRIELAQDYSLGGPALLRLDGINVALDKGLMHPVMVSVCRK